LFSRHLRRAPRRLRWLKSKMREAFEEVLGEELGGTKSVEVSYGPNWGEQTELEDPSEKE
jgi:hypothetical protein